MAGRLDTKSLVSIFLQRDQTAHRPRRFADAAVERREGSCAETGLHLGQSGDLECSRGDADAGLLKPRQYVPAERVLDPANAMIVSEETHRDLEPVV